MAATSLEGLHQQIAQREQELQALRQELESRQAHLSELTRRKEELQSQLRQVEEEIASLGTTKPASPQSPSTNGTSKKAAKSVLAAKKRQLEQPSLREVLTAILKGSRQPLFGSELAKEALAAGYHSNSKNFTNTVTALLTKLENVEHITGKGYRLKRKA